MKDNNQPKVQKKPFELKNFNNTRIDNYYWLNNRDNPEVIDYLNQENEYYESNTFHTVNFQKKLFEEIKNKIKEDDESVPYFLNGYWYVTKFKENLNYPIHVRFKKTLNAKEEIIFDCNELAKGHSYFNLSNFKVSPNNKIVAYSVDTVSRRLYTIKFKNLETGKIYTEEIKNTSGNFAWAEDNITLFYSARNVATLRNEKIFKHKLSHNPKKDELVFFEKDDTFYTSVFKSKSNKFIFIASSSTLTSEYRYLYS